MKKLILSFLMMMLPILSNAYDAKIGDIYYYFSGSNAWVTYKNTNYNSYSGAVVIPSTVTYSGTTYTVTAIYFAAFSGCTGLTSVTIPESVTSIGDCAFFNCGGLTYITIPDSVYSIGEKAFNGCSSLTSVTINSNAIASRSYSSSSTLANIFGSQVKKYIFGNGVQGIGKYACYNCSKLNSVTISNTVTSMGEYAFDGTPWYNNQPDGLVYAGKVAYKYKGTMPTRTEIELKEGTTGIANYAFYSCDHLTSVTIPNSVKSIGSYAFYNCYHLTSVIIPESVISIGDYSFNRCSGLTDVTIGRGVTNLGDDAFSGCNGLTSVTINSNAIASMSFLFKIFGSQVTEYIFGNGVQSIGENACYNSSDYSQLTSVTIGSSVTRIGSGAFSNCRGLTYITIPNSVTSIGSSAFSGCSGLTFFTIPNSVTSIGSFAFYNCSRLSSVDIGNSVTRIGIHAFQGCSDFLTSVHITDLAAWCNISFDDGYANPLYYAHHLFLNGQEITDLVIPNNVTSIGSFAFFECTGLTSVTIPNSVTSIGRSTFYDCSDLASITIGSGVTSIDDFAFDGCSGLTSVAINSNAIASESYSGSSTLANIFGSQVKEYIFGNGVQSIGKYACYNCSKLDYITISNTVTSIGEYAFNGTHWYNNRPDGLVYAGKVAYKYKGTMPAKTEIILKEGTTGIASSAFSHCSDLTSISIPESVSNIGNNAFNGCSSLTSVTIPENVTSIGSSAFGNCSGLTDVFCYVENVPNTNSNAFEDSPISSATLHVLKRSLETYRNTVPWSDFGTIVAIVINNSPIIAFADAKLRAICVANWDTDGDRELSEAEAAAVTDLGEVFKGKTQITSFNELQYFTGLTSIGESAFSGCSGLTSIEIPNSVTSIGESAFSGCSGLTSIEIPNSVTSIGESAFSGCSGLTSIEIPNSVTSFGRDAFLDCTGLQKVIVSDIAAWCGINFANGIGNPLTSSKHLYSDENTEIKNLIIPNSVTKIGNHAFRKCSGLTSVTIPNSVIKIGSFAFEYCTGLTSITISDSVTSIGERAFSSCTGLTSITIPNSVTGIGDGAFYSCSGLTSITVENGNTKYDSRDNCNGIIETATNTLITGCKNTTIPNTVTSIRQYAFSHHYDLTYITIPNSVTSIGSKAFEYCSGLTDVFCYVEGVPETNSSAFSNTHIGFATLHVPAVSLQAYRKSAPWSSFGTIVAINNSPIITFADANVKAICVANWDTDGDRELSEDEAAAVTDLGEVFKGKTQITSFNELQYFTGLTKIGKNAFRRCSSLTSVTIPNSVTSIGELAFHYCKGLTSVTIPNGVTSIGDGAFASCTGLTSITVESGNTKYDSRDNCNGIIETATNTLITGCKNTTIPNSVTSIGSNAFESCRGLTSITIPNSVTNIGDYAFYFCSGLTDVYCYVENVPNTNSNAFENSPIGSATLHVPASALEQYKATTPWSDFGTIVALTDEDAIGEAKADVNTNMECYDIQGRKLDKPQRGINIIRYSDGTSKKILIK